MTTRLVQQDETGRHVRPVALAVVALALGIAWDVLFYKHEPGISVPLFFGAAIFCIALLDRLTHKLMNAREIWLCFLILFLSAFFAIRASEFVLLLDAVAIMYLFLLLIAHLYGANVRQFRLFDFIFFPLLDILANIMRRFDIITKLYPNKRTAGSRKIMTGILLSVLFVTLFAALFSSADLVVSSMFEKLFSEQLETAAGHAAVVAVFGVSFLLLFAPAFWKRVEARGMAEQAAKRDFGTESMLVFLASNAVFLGFIIIQAVYLFGGSEKIASFGLSHAAYAREGFFQLLVVAMIVAAMVWGMRFVKHERMVNLHKALQSLLIAQTFVILASSWLRLTLYENAYGFTELRLFSHYFLAMVATIMILLFIGIVSKVRDNSILHGIVSIFAVGLVGLNLINPDLFIATRNAERPTDVRPLDTAYLLSLSDDAAPVIMDLINSQTIQTTKPAEYDIDPTINIEYNKYLLFVDWKNRKTPSDWQSWNLARLRADLLRAELKR